MPHLLVAIIYEFYVVINQPDWMLNANPSDKAPGTPGTPRRGSDVKRQCYSNYCVMYVAAREMRIFKVRLRDYHKQTH